MASIVNFNGRKIIEPGVYARVIGTPNVTPSPVSTGNVLLIDTGSNATFGGGSGISGALNSDKNSIYQFSDAPSFKNFVKGGLFWDIADYLFGPSNNGQGVPLLTYVRAASTTQATLTYTFAGAQATTTTTTTTSTTSTTSTSTSTTSTSTTSTTLVGGGVFAIKTKDEGLIANGTANLAGTKVVKGYATKMFAGVVDPTKFYIEFYLGTFKGLDISSEPYDGIASEDSSPILITRSTEFSTVSQLYTWAANDAAFNAAFIITTQSVLGGGYVSVYDLANNSALKLFTGATETYNSTYLNQVLADLTDVDNSFILADKWNTDSANAYNQTILTWLINTAQFGEYLFVGGADTAANFDLYTTATAQGFNSSRAVVVDSGIVEKSLITPSLNKNKGSIYSAALALGRIAGLEPQTPGTYKDVRIKKLQNELNHTQRETALQNGVLHFRFVPTLGIVINQSINTLQKNTQMVNVDGQSCEISVMRIADTLNKLLVLNARVTFIGGNGFSSSPAIIKTFTENLLRRFTVTTTQDNLILPSSDNKGNNVVVQQTGTDVFVTYSFLPNGPINKIMYTGVSLPINFASA